jgi:flagella basal body P-ring formation protein FlgA
MEVAMNGGRPLGIRKTVQLMVILTILAWATQTLLSQWGYGATPAEAKEATQAKESFVPPADNGGGSKSGTATLEVRGEATVIGGDVKLKQICRWNTKDNAHFAPIADLVLVRLGADAPYRTLTVQELKQILHDAGISLSGINFSGAVSCTVDRTDIEVDEGKALQKWMTAREAPAKANQPDARAAQPQEVPALFPADEAPAAQPAEGAEPAAPVRAAEGPFHTLRDILAEDLAQRLGLDAAQLQLQFNLRDDKVLSLAEPQFRFNIVPQRARALGPVNWQVEVVTDTGVQRVEVVAMARAWQDQIVLTRPISAKQIIREQDVTQKRALVDKLDDQPLLVHHQVVGNQAARDLKPGAVFNAKMVEPVPLARTGQFVTVTLTTSNVSVKTVARAMESGSYGQTIKVKNEATKEIYEVILTGPQTAEMNGGAMHGDKANAKEAKVASARE